MNTLVSDDLRERLVRLETEMKHVTTQLDDMGAQLKTLVDLLNQAKGARWMLLGMATLGGFALGKLSTVLPFFRP
ncbi:MAG: hypothetical protein ACK515_17800 [bacterium]